MTARLGRAVANGNAAPSAKAVRRVSEELCNDDDVPCCFIRRELVGGSVRGNSDLCDRNCVCSACAGMICAFRSAWRGVSADAAATVSRATETTMRTILLAEHCMFTQYGHCHRREHGPQSAGLNDSLCATHTTRHAPQLLP